MKRNFYFTNQTCDRQIARDIELTIEAATNLDLENPFYDGEAKEVAELDAGNPTSLTKDEIVGMDLRKIRENEGILALFTADRNIGSSMEVAIGAFAWGKPVYVIATQDHLYEHPWIVYFATRRFRNVASFIEFWNKEGRHAR